MVKPKDIKTKFLNSIMHFNIQNLLFLWHFNNILYFKNIKNKQFFIDTLLFL